LEDKKVVFKNGDTLNIAIKSEERWGLSDYIRGGLQLVILLYL
jgi:hypothetical protein